MKGDGEAGGGSQGGGGAMSGAIGDDDNAARRPSGGRAAGWGFAGNALAPPGRPRPDYAVRAQPHPMGRTSPPTREQRRASNVQAPAAPASAITPRDGSGYSVSARAWAPRRPPLPA